MSRSYAIALLCGAAFVAVPASAGAASKFRPDCPAKLLRSANHHRAIVVERHGVHQAGRDIVKWGRVHANQRTYKATCREVRRYRAQLIVLHTEPRYHPLIVRTAAAPYRAPAGAATPSVAAPTGGTLESIAQCESDGNPSAIGGGGVFRGKYQFTFSTWASVGGSGDPAAASESEQDQRAAMLYAREGAAPWPVCGR